MTSTHDYIPLIDAKCLFDEDHPLHGDTVHNLLHSVQTSGFLILRNSALSPSIIDDVISSYRQFFSLPKEKKETVDMTRSSSNRGWGYSGAERVSSIYNSDYKEFFDCGIELPPNLPVQGVRYYDPNLWPSEDLAPNFRAKILSYYDAASEVSQQLLVAIARCIGLPAEYFSSCFTCPMSLLRGNYYPPRPDWASEKDFGIAPHTDYGCLTLVVSDGTPGLEVQTITGEWINVTPSVPGDIVVNFGDMLELWSGHSVRATMHRVVGSSEERYSCAFFYNPNYNTNIAPPTSQDVTSESSEPIYAGEYLTKRYDETYVHISEKKLTDNSITQPE
mmetsp:Transcript_2912/g.4423  ORF Transcript_2912/g.4423 Transcript_2912/m.4423 type:complete len:333 (-) Transcript_2912:171-1169(-)|eukprot:CAMPEP_0185024640 /NCGR_PEP_ID=MMETSP1103-20130426/7807_1 /TAXON_ID=36769 /ORGANISM="Paraphysomonas bandaiensis, Strain Caron Lab Isolate" /LENGTH=332 /DNA_ID=CAMNT_0027557663 /DNA_START=101 /DNA_END=1099 /DNA_ORIENTATION=+